MRTLLWIAAVFAFILFFPVGIRVYYANEALVRLYVFCIPITVLPASGKKQEEEEKSKLETYLDKIEEKLRPLFSKHKKTSDEERKTEPVGEKKQKKSGGIKELLKEEGVSGILTLLSIVAKIAAGTFGRLLKGIILPFFDFRMTVGAEDADKTAVSYGQACAAVYPALSLIFRYIKVFKKQIEVAPDFVSEKTAIRLDTLALVFPGLVLWEGLRALAEFIVKYIKHRIDVNKEKTERKN